MRNGKKPEQRMSRPCKQPRSIEPRGWLPWSQDKPRLPQNPLSINSSQGPSIVGTTRWRGTGVNVTKTEWPREAHP